MLKKVTCTWAALALLAGCAAQPAATRPEATVETAEAAVQPAQEQTTPGFANVGTLERIPSTCGGYWGWNTGDAYYEIARQYEEGDNSSMHALLLKTDYAAGRQTVLCNVPGCTHNNAACPAWLEDWARTDLLVMPSGIYLFYTGLDDVQPWDEVEKESREFFEQGYAQDFPDEEAYIDYCRHNYELDSRPTTLERLSDDLTARTTVATLENQLPSETYFTYCDENALYTNGGRFGNTSAGSKMYRLNLTDGTLDTIPLENSEVVMAAAGQRFLTARLVSDAPLPDNNDWDAYHAAMQNATYEYSWYDPQTLERQTVFSIPAENGFQYVCSLYKGRIYVQDNWRQLGEWDSQSSLSYYEPDGTRTELVDDLPGSAYLPETDSGFMPTFSGKQRNSVWVQKIDANSNEADYLYDLDTGGATRITQQQSRDARYVSVSLMAETNDGRWLVGYKPHTNVHNDRCDYGLIDPQAFLQGSTDYAPVEMWP